MKKGLKKLTAVMLLIEMSTGQQIRPVKLTSMYSNCVISSPKPMFDHLLESSRRDDSNNWSNIGSGEEIGI